MSNVETSPPSKAIRPICRVCPEKVGGDRRPLAFNYVPIPTRVLAARGGIRSFAPPCRQRDCHDNVVVVAWTPGLEPLVGRGGELDQAEHGSGVLRSCLNRDLIDAPRLTAQNQVVCPIERGESVLRLHGNVAGKELYFALATDAGAAIVVDAHAQVLGGFEHRLAGGYGQGLAGAGEGERCGAVDSRGSW